MRRGLVNQRFIHAKSLCRALAATIYDAKKSEESSVDISTPCADHSRRDSRRSNLITPISPLAGQSSAHFIYSAKDRKDQL